MMEPTAVLDTLGVRPELRGRHVGGALISQLRSNLLGLGIQRLQTEVAWDSLELITFFHHEGFRPAPQLSLELDLNAARARAERPDPETEESLGERARA
jgi:N-acetylglutamate synthase-like GNAT family acetyltransferase